jgi:hypothetical protein
VTSLRLTVTQVGSETGNVGLAEFQTFALGDSNPPPTGEPSNIAPLASVTASSERAPTQDAQNAVDGVADGYPSNPGHEWATVTENAGAWIDLQWPTSHVVSSVRLHDRPNADDQVLGATLTFSDGSSVAVGALANNGGGVTIEFAPRSVTSVRLTITASSPSTVNVGLAEFFVFASASN